MERSFTCMDAQVVGEMTAGLERFLTVAALVRSSATVFESVGHKLTCSRE